MPLPRRQNPRRSASPADWSWYVRTNHPSSDHLSLLDRQLSRRTVRAPHGHVLCGFRCRQFNNSSASAKFNPQINAQRGQRAMISWHHSRPDGSERRRSIASVFESRHPTDKPIIGPVSAVLLRRYEPVPDLFLVSTKVRPRMQSGRRRGFVPENRRPAFFRKDHR